MRSRGDDLADLKVRVRLSDHVARKVKLRRIGPDLFGPCPFHDEKTGSFSVNDAKGFFHCFGCHAHGDILDWWQKAEGMSFADALDRLRREAGASQWRAERVDTADDDDARRKRAEARRIWTESAPIAGTVADTYLRRARRIAIDPLPEALRCHPALPAGSDGFCYPAMVAAVVGSAGDVLAIQRTFLRPDGIGKAQMPAAKRSLGPLADGAVRLAPAGPTLGLAEGIETALSAAELFMLPVWAMLGLRYERVALPAGVRNIVIFGDRGEAGEKAADAARESYRGRGYRVAVRVTPTAEHKDWNDVLRSRRDGA